jgi:hypothetical protein
MATQENTNLVRILPGDVCELFNGERVEVKAVMISPYFREELEGVVRLYVKSPKPIPGSNRPGSFDYILPSEVQWVCKWQEPPNS